MSLAQPTLTQTQEPFWRWRDVFIILVALVVLLTGAHLLTSAMVASGDAIPWGVNLGLLAAQVMTMLGSVYIILRWRGLDHSILKLQWPPRRWLISALIFALILRLWTGPLAGLLSLLGFSMDNPQTAFFAPEDMTILAGIGMLIFGGLAIPVAEEVVFRGVVYTWLRQWGKRMALIISSLLFAIAHVHPTIIVLTFFLGLASGILYERSQSLWPSIIVHSLFNISGILLIYIYLALGIDISGGDASAAIVPIWNIAR